jgi:hypothetical protein
VSNVDPKASAPEAALSTALRELAHSAPQSAPPELGDSLMRAFHRHHHRRRVMRATSLYFAMVAVFAGSLPWVRTQSTRTSMSRQPAATRNANPKPAGRQEPEKSTELNLVGTAVSPQPTQKRRLATGITPVFAKTSSSSFARRSSVLHRRTASPAATAQNDPANHGLFVALPSFAFCAPHEELHVIRVNLPISSLRLLGAPIDEESMTRRVTTDLLIGSDGTPYAVRLVM